MCILWSCVCYSMVTAHGGCNIGHQRGTWRDIYWITVRSWQQESGRAGDWRLSKGDERLTVVQVRGSGEPGTDDPGEEREAGWWRWWWWWCGQRAITGEDEENRFGSLTVTPETRGGRVPHLVDRIIRRREQRRAGLLTRSWLARSSAGVCVCSASATRQHLWNTQAQEKTKEK